ncbi:hypothetical protein ACWIGI_37820 [Nocardia sp. NPDC055321]
MREIEHSGHYIYTSGRFIHADLEFEWDARGGITPAECAREAARLTVAGIGELCRDFFRPLDFGLLRRVTEDSDGLWFETDSHPEPGYWEPESVREHGDSEIVDTVDEATMLSVVDALFDAPCELNEGEWVSWTGMQVLDTMALLPESLVPPIGDHVVVDDADNRFRNRKVPIERRPDGVWTGPRDSTFGPPFQLRAYPDFGSSDNDRHYLSVGLLIYVNWSIWRNRDAPGRAMLDRGLDRLRRGGWQVRED